MTNCEFLIFERSPSCGNCTGWRCIAKGRKKKVGDTTICTDPELTVECVRYLSVYPQAIERVEEISSIETFRVLSDIREFKIKPKAKPIFDPTKPPPLPTLCPYLGPPPPDVQTCCGMYCHANNEALRTGIQCKSRPTWLECRHKGLEDKKREKRRARANS